MKDYKKRKKLFMAALLSGCLLFQCIQPMAASGISIKWLEQSPFTLKDAAVPAASSALQIETETEAQTETETAESESETGVDDKTAAPSDQKSSVSKGSPLRTEVTSDNFRELLKAVTLTNYELELSGAALSWEQLEAELTYRINSYASQWSLYLKDLSTGNIISINERPQESASLIKLYVMGAIMQDIYDGKLEMTDKIRNLLENMITVSDNSATNELVRYLDPDHSHRAGLERVNAFIDEQGFDNTHEYNGLEDTSLHYNPDKINTTSTQDCGELLERIYRGEFVSHLSSRKMEDLLLAQQVTYKIPSTIPDESTVANKTGETSDCENDAAIVYTPNGDYILCIMSYKLSDKGSAVSYLREMSSLIYDYFMNRN